MYNTLSSKYLTSIYFWTYLKDFFNLTGFDRQIEYKDRLSMPYTEAFLLEVLRIANIASTALPHVYEKDITVAGKYVRYTHHGYDDR